MAGIAALLLTARMNSAHPTAAIGMEFDAIAAVAVGGTSFERGNGWLFGTLLGVVRRRAAQRAQSAGDALLGAGRLRRSARHSRPVRRRLAEPANEHDRNDRCLAALRHVAAT